MSLAAAQQDIDDPTRPGPGVHLAYLSSSPMPSAEANAVHVARIVTAFEAAGCRVELHARSAAGTDAMVKAQLGLADSVRLERHAWPAVPILGPAIYALSLARAVRRCAPTVVYGRHATSLLLATRGGVPFGIELHVPPRRLLDRVIFRRLMRRPGMRVAIAITHAVALELRRLAPPSAHSRIVVEPDAADPPSPEALPPSARGARRPGPRRVGYVGSLHPGKGALEIVLPLAHRMPEVTFHIAGGDDAQLWQLRADAPANLVVHGHLPHEAVTPFLSEVDLDVALAPYQPVVQGARGRVDIARWMSPLKIFEYAAHGIPLIASDLPVLREILHDGNAVLCTSDDIDAWERSLRHLLEDGTRRRQLSEEGLTWTKAHTWDLRAQRILARLIT